MQGSSATRGEMTISQKRIQQLAIRARVRPAAGDKRASPASGVIDGARGKGNGRQVVGAAWTCDAHARQGQ